MKQRMVMIAALSAGLLLAACASSPEQTTEDILSKRGYAVAERVERIKNYRIIILQLMHLLSPVVMRPI